MITDGFETPGLISVLYWIVMNIGRGPVQLQISTCYVKSGGVGSNPDRVSIFFAHFSDRFFNIMMRILILTIFIAFTSNKSQIYISTFSKCAKKILTRPGFEPTPQGFSKTCRYLQRHRSPSYVHNSSVQHGNWSRCFKTVSYHHDRDITIGWTSVYHDIWPAIWDYKHALTSNVIILM